jgi:hypothetical protein
MSEENNNSNISITVSDISGNDTINKSEKSEIDEIPTTSDVDIHLHKIYGKYDTSENTNWFSQKEYIIFRSELKSVKQNNLVVLKECKENKRLLDLKYDDLNNLVNNIQTSVIFCSTISGLLQATRVQFGISDDVISVVSIFISTYISLLLSISKYYKLDEIKERIQTLREKFSLLHNQLDYRMDLIGPWYNKNIWKHKDPKKKLLEWSELYTGLCKEYEEIIDNKKNLVTDFEIIMDTKSRNKYHILNRELNYNNRKVLFLWDKKESELEESNLKTPKRVSSVTLQHEDLDNWAEIDSDDDIV